MNYYLDTEFHEYKKRSLFNSPTDTIELISIGIVDETGNTFYAISNEFDVKAAWKNKWLRENVLQNIHTELFQMLNPFAKTYFSSLYDFSVTGLKRLLVMFGKSIKEIREEILEFTVNFVEVGSGYKNLNTDTMCSKNLKYTYQGDLVDLPKFYGYYADYDWVVFCWIFGRMIDLPIGFPMYCIDLKQILDEKGLDKGWVNYNCPQPTVAHNSLQDALWNKKLHLLME